MTHLFQAVSRIFKEKNRIRFIVSRILLRSGINLHKVLVFDKKHNIKTYLHASSAAHKLYTGKYNPQLDVVVFENFITEPDAVVYDIGANIGMFSVLAAKLAPEGKIYAFEATAKTFNYLTENIRLNATENIFASFAAICDKTGFARFFEHDYSHEQNYIDVNSTNGATVPAIRLDDFNRMIGTTTIDFLKIDVEGAELQVLKSLGSDLKNVKIVYLEVCDRNSARFGYQESELINFLLENNFSLEIPTLKNAKLETLPYQSSAVKGLNIIAKQKNI